jgi:hypothetical protein
LSPCLAEKIHLHLYQLTFSAASFFSLASAEAWLVNTAIIFEISWLEQSTISLSAHLFICVLLCFDFSGSLRLKEDVKVV